MPEVLVVDTATPAVTAAVVRVRPGRVEALSVQVAADARRHGELLAPEVADALAAAGLVPGDLAAAVAGLGPGPFTGLRVGLVTAAALADALQIPAYGVCSLDGLALPVAARGRVLAVTDARRREVYWAAYEDGSRIAGPEVSRPADLAGLARKLGVEVATGAGARRYVDVLGLPVTGPDSPDPVALARLAAWRVLAGAPTEPLTPLYLRRPDAVEPGRPKAVTAAGAKGTVSAPARPLVPTAAASGGPRGTR
ncbi:MAG TPA: tRNA (adenosine(37)-N6)-threonylcarbamoyltransferase complex dimerization subunit type 1 TsaB [Mycobacteriales bacterium]|nr:tRNA (adenosine(37)-N6)-threonylcarbamoyltransferase complex dimerization subunit type 1 TsaB [Mycobacteriales bacterium]